MAKAKRKKLIAREPSGRPSRTMMPTYESRPAEIRRIRDYMLRDSRDQRLGTQLGRLFLEGKLGDSGDPVEARFAAGNRWARLARRYLEIICAPNTGPGMAALLEHTTSHPPDPDSEAGRDLAERERDEATEFLKAQGCLSVYGTRVYTVVRRICEDDLSPAGYEDQLALRDGLQALADHWGLVQRKARAIG